MRYVDHDPAAARAAALRCREAAHDYDCIAGVVARSTATAAWWGTVRDRVVTQVEALAGDLRREAAALRTSAELLEAAARAAERRDADLTARAEAEAAAAVAAPCPPTSRTPSVTHSTSQPRGRRSGSQPTSSTVPTGVR